MNRSDSEHERRRDFYPHDCTAAATSDEMPIKTMPVNKDGPQIGKSPSAASGLEAPVIVKRELNDELGGGMMDETMLTERQHETGVVSTSNQWSVDQPENGDDEFSVPRLQACKQVMIQRPDADGQSITRQKWVPLR